MGHEALVTLLKQVKELESHTLTATVNEIRPAATFIRSLLFSRTELVETDKIEIGLRFGDRTIAPFVRVGGEALIVGGLSDKFHTVSPANIRIKHPFTAIHLLYTRLAGSPVFVNRRQQATAVQRRIADDLQEMKHSKDNAIEWLCSQTLTGTISYQVEPNENFLINIPRPATHSLLAPVFWDNADPQLPNPEQDAHLVKRILSNNPGLTPQVCILGTEAAIALINLTKRQNMLFDKRRLNDGNVELQNQFQEAGAIFLGRLFGIDFWEYSRTLKLPAVQGGGTVELIRPKYAEFVHTGPAADRRLYFGSIPDMTAMQNGNHITDEFVKSYVQEDPSQITYLMHSRPLPWPRRANTWVSMKVVSG